MNLDIRRARRNELHRGLDPGPEGGGPDHIQDTGEPGADHHDRQTPEAGGAPKAHEGNATTPESETGDLKVDPEIERKTIQGEENPKRHQKATAQPGGHAARVGDAGKVEAAPDHLKSPLKGEAPGLHLLEDTKRKRKGTRKGTGTARVTKSAFVRNVNAPPARKRKAKTKNASGRGNQTERKEMSRSPEIMMKKNKATTARKSGRTGRILTTLLCLLIL